MNVPADGKLLVIQTWYGGILACSATSSVDCNFEVGDFLDDGTSFTTAPPVPGSAVEQPVAKGTTVHLPYTSIGIIDVTAGPHTVYFQVRAKAGSFQTVGMGNVSTTVVLLG